VSYLSTIYSCSDHTLHTLIVVRIVSDGSNLGLQPLFCEVGLATNFTKTFHTFCDKSSNVSVEEYGVLNDLEIWCHIKIIVAAK